MAIVVMEKILCIPETICSHHGNDVICMSQQLGNEVKRQGKANKSTTPRTVRYRSIFACLKNLVTRYIERQGKEIMPMHCAVVICGLAQSTRCGLT